MKCISNVFSPKREIIPLIGTESSWYVHLLAQTVKQALCHVHFVFFDFSLISAPRGGGGGGGKLCVSKNRKRRQ